MYTLMSSAVKHSQPAHFSGIAKLGFELAVVDLSPRALTCRVHPQRTSGSIGSVAVDVIDHPFSEFMLSGRYLASRVALAAAQAGSGTYRLDESKQRLGRDDGRVDVRADDADHITRLENVESACHRAGW